MSRIGKTPISLPDKVKVTVADGNQVTVEGPKGKLSWELPKDITISTEGSVITVSRANEHREVRALH